MVINHLNYLAILTMLPRPNRFSFRSKLPKNTLNSQSFSIRYDKNEGGLKVGVVVSKKVDKRAVVRNRIKRVILETVRLNVKKEEGLTLVFYAKSEAAGNEKLAEEVKNKLLEIVSVV